MKKIILSLSLVGSLMAFENIASAEEMLNVQTSATSNSAKLDWEDIGDQYQLFKNGQLFWEGENSSLNVTEIEDDSFYDFRLVAKDKGEIVEVNQIKQSTTKKSETNRSYLKKNSDINAISEYVKNDATITSVVGKDYVKLEWSAIPDEDGFYEIYRDNVKIGKTRNNNFIDSTVNPETVYHYSIKVINKLSDGEYQNRLEEIEKNNVKLTNNELLGLQYHQFDLIRVVKTLYKDDYTNIKKDSKVLEQNIASLASTNKYTFSYTTFIPTDTAPNPFGALTGSYFKGDGRGFDLYSNKYRTRAEHTVTFNSNSATITPKYTTKETILYKKDGTIASRKTAPTTGMKMTNSTTDSSQVTYRFTHDVGIPIYDGATPDITYYNFVRVNNDGSLVVTGDYDGAPSHEMYVFIPNSDVKATLLNATHQGFGSLFPPAEHSFNLSL